MDKMKRILRNDALCAKSNGLSIQFDTSTSMFALANVSFRDSIRFKIEHWKTSVSSESLYCILIEWYKQRTADRAARSLGTVYRVVAGTESIDLNINKQATRSTDDDTDFDHNNDDNDSTSRQLSAGDDNGVMQFPHSF